MENIQNSAVEEELQPIKADTKRAQVRKFTSKDSDAKEQPNISSLNVEEPLNKYSEAANTGGHSRYKRATRRDENKNTCSLYIQTDPLIWKHIREGFPEVVTLIFLISIAVLLEQWVKLL